MSPTRKYRGQRELNGERVYWDAHTDHFPMVGGGGPMMTPEEVRGSELAANARYGLFTLPADTDAYLEVYDQTANGLCHVTKAIEALDKDDPRVLYVHLFWVEVVAVPGSPVEEPEKRRGDPWTPFGM
jgi:hypothetical protein